VCMCVCVCIMSNDKSNTEVIPNLLNNYNNHLCSSVESDYLKTCGLLAHLVESSKK